MITHGCVGSVVGPLGFGVPLVVVPMGADQRENADQIATTGFGRVIDPASVTRALKSLREPVGVTA